jgi:hypothetical protein
MPGGFFSQSSVRCPAGCWPCAWTGGDEEHVEWSKCKYRLYMQCSASSAHRLDSIREIAQKHNLESPAAVGGHMQSLWTRFMKGATVAAMRSFKEKTNEVLRKFGVDYNFDEPCLQTLGFSKGVVPQRCHS